MAIETRIDEEAYLRLAFAEPDRKWELVDGRLREKPAMTFRHNQWEITVGFAIRSQLDLSVYEVRIDAGRLRKPGATYYIPDVFVFPLAFATEFKDRDDVLEVYDEPLPLVVEIWSRSTGGYDVEEKLADYQARGDAEIWRLHPFERTLMRWVRQADGSYEESLLRGGVIRLAALPGVAIDLDALFAG
jgi:Uma2 family endonuclease